MSPAPPIHNPLLLPTLYGLFVGILAAVLMGSIFSCARTAFAETWTGGTFTYNGNLYPSSLAGVVVTFNANPGSPDDYIGRETDVPIIWRSGTWYQVNAKSVADISGNEVLSGYNTMYWLSEGTSVNNPWFVAWSSNNSSTVGSGTQYYNGASYSRAWYPNGTATRTILFDYTNTVGNVSTNYKLLLHHDFIRYVVDNSDFRTRYTMPNPSTPDLSITTVNDTTNGTITVSWSGNPDIWIQRREGTDNWVTVQYVPAPSPYVFTVPQTGYYRVYGMQTGYNTYTSPGVYFTVAGIDFVSGTVSMSSDYSTLYVGAVFNNPQPTTVAVQYANDNPLSSDYGQWKDMTIVLQYNSSTGVWEHTYDWSQAQQYTKIRLKVTGGGTIQYFELGKTDYWSESENTDIDGYLSTLVHWITQFVDGVGDLFMWLPADLRAIVVAALVIMIVVGLVGFLKG